MVAFLLAAGYGTRLRPLTDTVPKCLVPICGRPLLDIWMELLLSHGISDVYINTHYLYAQVRAFIEEYNSRNTGLRAHEIYEETLLGSGGTVKKGREFIPAGEDFLICNADNLTDIDISSLIRRHKEKKPVLTMALFRTNHPQMCGIATVNEDGIITEFTEKPENPASNLANAGIYIASEKIFESFPDDDYSDFGFSVLPALCNKMIGVETDSFLMDIGTMDNYMQAQEAWKSHDNYKNTAENQLRGGRN